MKPLRSTPEFKTLVRRVIRFEKPEQALRDPVRFMAYAMTYGTWEDMKKNLPPFFGPLEIKNGRLLYILPPFSPVIELLYGYQ